MKTSLILRTTARALLPIMLMFSLIVLLRGHNEPGGGFVGGLLAAAGFSLYALALGMREARALLRLPPAAFISVGLMTSAMSGLPGLVTGGSFMEGIWWTIPVAGFPGGVTLGTPVIFDVGVYLAVMGVVLLMVFSLEDYHHDRAARA